MHGEVADSVTARFEGRALRDIEGVWQWKTGATVAISVDDRGLVELVLVDTTDPLIDTPQVMGTGTFGGKKGLYHLKLHSGTNRDSGTFDESTHDFVAQIDNDGQLILKPFSTGYKISVRRLLPYLFRLSITNQSAPDGIEGARRIYPRYGTPDFPVVL